LTHRRVPDYGLTIRIIKCRDERDDGRFWHQLHPRHGPGVVGHTPDKATLIEADRVVTYAQLDDRSNRIAPKEIHLMDTLPHTASGKVQKAALRQQLRASPQQRA
jgi:non-ribosomal peptide synthetase component E (peptide arylation enzyme)